MQQHSNAYIIGFAAAVCLVCSIVVSSSAVALRERQEQNKVLDRQKKVLTVAGLMQTGEAIDATEVAFKFEKSIRARIVDLATGEYDDTVDVATFDQRKATKDPELSIVAPANRAGLTRVPKKALVYEKVSQEFKRDGDADHVDLYILPIEGKGLWSTLYGFLALAPDGVTIEGITFYEHGETPGLGGEIENPAWQGLWVGRKAYDETGQPAITVIKGTAGSVEDDPYRIDGLSGSTLTGRGVAYLVQFWLSDRGFDAYLDRIRGEGSAS